MGICPVCQRHWAVNARTLNAMAVGIPVRGLAQKRGRRHLSRLLAPLPLHLQGHPFGWFICYSTAPCGAHVDCTACVDPQRNPPLPPKVAALVPAARAEHADAHA